jgi:hypothetical protein
MNVSVKNADLAMKEFKDVVAIARRLGFAAKITALCTIIWESLIYTYEKAKRSEPRLKRQAAPFRSTQELLAPKPTPTPLPPTPTPKPDPIEISIKIPRALETASPQELARSDPSREAGRRLQ